MSAFTFHIPIVRLSHVALMDADIRSKIEGKTVTELREAFPGEAQCHRAMMSRAKNDGATVHKNLRALRDFLRHLGPRPSKDWTVDRIDPTDPEYAQGKVRWADKRQQANNRRNTLFLNIEGQIKPLTDWARLTNQKASTIRQRLVRGADHKEAVYPPREGRGLRFRAVPEQLDGSASEWPEPLTPRLWEGPYQKWVAASKGARSLPLTRRVFALWIEASRAKALHEYLVAKYPGSSLPSPDRTDHEAAVDRERHANYLVHDKIRRELLAEATYDERQFWMRTLRPHRVVEPKLAANAMGEQS